MALAQNRYQDKGWLYTVSVTGRASLADELTGAAPGFGVGYRFGNGCYLGIEAAERMHFESKGQEEGLYDIMSTVADVHFLSALSPRRNFPYVEVFAGAMFRYPGSFREKEKGTVPLIQMDGGLGAGYAFSLGNTILRVGATFECYKLTTGLRLALDF